MRPDYRFPTSPEDGQYFLREDGFIYQYDPILARWDKLRKPIDYLEEAALQKLPYTGSEPGSMIKAIIEDNIKD